MAGIFNTTYTCKTVFSLPELHDSAKIIKNLYVTENLGTYDMILGRNTLRELGIVINFNNNQIEWNGAQAPMKKSDCKLHTDFHIEDSELVTEETDRMKRILDAKYKKQT